MIAMFIYPILIPCMVILYGNIGDSVEDGQETLIGINYELSEEEKVLLKELKIEYNVYETEEDMNKAFKDKDINGYITKRENNTFTIYVDESTTDGLTTQSSLGAYMESYNSVLTAKYIADRGIDPTVAFSQLTYEFEGLETNNYMVTILLAISLTYTILAICISSSNMAISTTATEKENGTLETILTFPIKKGELITGKYASSVIVGFIAAVVSLILMITSFNIGSKQYEIFKDISLNINFLSILGCVLVCLLAAIFIAGIAMFLTSFSKSYKEAQSKIGLINILGMIPMFVSILNIEVNKVYYLIPICNHVELLQELLLSKIDVVNLLIAVCSTVLYTYIVIKSIIKLYNSENILFNT